MEKIKISVYNLYKNNINYNMIGGAPAPAKAATLLDATNTAKGLAKADNKAKMELAIAQADLQQQLATDQFTESQRSAKQREQLAKAQLEENIEARKQRFELEKARLDAENYTLDKCRNDVKEYMFYNLRNQIEMNTLQTTYGKTDKQMKDLLKDNNFDFEQVKNQLQAEADAAAAKEAEEVGDAIAKLFTAEGKIVVKVHKLRK